MMYLSKSVDAAPASSSETGRQDLTEYYRLYGFHRWVYSSQLDNIREFCEKNGNTLADVLAAQAANLFETEQLRRKEFVVQGLQFCRDVLMDRGYKEMDVPGITNIGKSAPRNVMLTVGCQTEELLESRIRATVDTCFQLASAQCLVDLVLSGNNPGSPKVRIQNESSRMRLSFFDLWQKQRNMDLLKRLNVDVLSEYESSKSGENVSRFLEMKRDVLKEKNNLFIVSSNFHLNRLSLEVENQIRHMPDFNIQKIVLVGSEDVKRSTIVSAHHSYVKSMLFEIYRYLVLQKDYWNFKR